MTNIFSALYESFGKFWATVSLILIVAFVVWLIWKICKSQSGENNQFSKNNQIRNKNR